MSEAAGSRLTRFHIAGCVAAIFTVKCAVMWQLKDHILLQPDAGLDTGVYLSLTQRVLAGDIALGPGMYFVSPLYIYFAASILAFVDSVIWLRLVQIILGTAAVALMWWCGREWAGKRAGWFAAGLASLTGLFTFYESLLLQAAIDPFLTALALAAFTAALTRPRWIWFVTAGGVFGIQSLNRPNILIAAAGLIVLLFLGKRSRGAVATLAGLLLALAPMMIRNGRVADVWSPLASHGGLNFYIGNNPAADGTYVVIPGITPSIVGQQQDARRVAELAVGHELDDAGISSHFYRSGLLWIRDHPWPAARLFARKLVYVFNSAHLSLNYSYPFYAYDAGTALRALAVGPWLLIPLGLAGAASLAWMRRDSAFCIWAAFIPLYAVAVAVFFVSERYRLPLLVPLCIAGGAALDTLFSALVARRWHSVGVLFGLIGFLGLGANWHLGLDDARAEERTRMAERSASLNRVDDVERWTAKAEEIHPTPGVVHFRVGRALAVAGRPVASLTHLQQAARLDPDRPETSYALGQVLVDSGRASEAVPHLRRALSAGVRPDLAGFDLSRALASTGDLQGALQVLQDVKPAQNDDAASWLQMGQLAQQLGDLTLATRFYSEAARAAPGASDPREQIGLMRALMGDFEAAAAELERAVVLNPSDPTARLNLAVASLQLGRTDDARVQAQEALRLAPGYVKAREFLESLKK